MIKIPAELEKLEKIIYRNYLIKFYLECWQEPLCEPSIVSQYIKNRVTNDKLSEFKEVLRNVCKRKKPGDTIFD
ncbi:hypothetical protein KAI19_05945, partial [bacterium]|nr:hypothetical protein [bacterium]